MWSLMQSSCDKTELWKGKRGTAVASWDFPLFCHSHAGVSCFFPLHTMSSLAFPFFFIPLPPRISKVVQKQGLRMRKGSEKVPLGSM